MPEFVFVKPDRKAQLAELRKECAGYSKRLEKTREALLCALFFQEKMTIQSGRFMDELSRLRSEVNRRIGMFEANQTAREFDTVIGMPRIRSSDFVHKDIPNSTPNFSFDDDLTAAKSAAGHLKEMLAAVNEIQNEMGEAQKSAKYLKENGFFWVAECVAPAIANCKKTAPSIMCLWKFLKGIPFIPENPQPTQETYKQFKKLGDFIGRLFDEPQKIRILSFCDFDESNSSGATKSIGMFVRGLFTCFPQLQNDERLISLCIPLENSENILHINYGSLVHFSVSYICDGIMDAKRKGLLAEIARRNTTTPTFKQMLPAAETIAKPPHKFPAQKKDSNNTKEAEFRRSFEETGALQEEMDTLLSIRSALLRLNFFTDAKAQLGLYRAECGNGISPSQIAQKMASLDKKCAECASTLSKILSHAGIGEDASQEIAKAGASLACERLFRKAASGDIKDFFRENADEILLAAAETSEETNANIDFYLSFFCETLAPKLQETGADRRVKMIELQESLIRKIKAETSPLYVRALLSSFCFNGTTFIGKANIPKAPVERKARWLIEKMEKFRPSFYGRAESFLCKTGILEIRTGRGRCRHTYHLIISEPSVQDETAKEILSAVMDFYGRPKP